MLTRAVDAALACLIPVTVLVHLVFSPSTKVEESFGLQATHDILTYGIPWFSGNQTTIDQYDHVEFSGSVPRTFVGPLALAGASWPFIRLWKDIDRQVIVRGVLGLFNSICLLWFRSGVVDVFGRGSGNWFVIFTASQFHLMYYASRTLPNFFAFGLTTIALHDLLPLSTNLHSEPSMRRYHHALMLLTAVGVVFRSELALLLGSHTLYLLIQRRIEADPLEDILPFGLVGALIGLGISVPIDSYFWQKRPIWPELTGFLYNFLAGKSSDWGVSPFYYYFTSSIPRLLFNPITYNLCIPITFAVPSLRKKMRDILFPNLFFVFLYSFQPHKEWRFIVYIIPPVTAVVSAGASWIWTRRRKSLVYRFLSLSLIASVFASFAASYGMLYISSLNYPGADALARLHQLTANHDGQLKVHMDTFSCMTGITRFLQHSPSLGKNNSSIARPIWHYDKTEDEETLLRPEFWLPFDWTLAAEPERVIGKWEIVDVANGYSGVGIIRPGPPANPDKYDDPDSTPMERIVTARSVVHIMKEGQDLGRVAVSIVSDSNRRAELWEHTKCAARDASVASQRLRRSHSWSERKEYLNEHLATFLDLIRRYITGGYWVEIRRKPMVSILRQTRTETL